MKEFQDVLGKRALVARAVANLLPENHWVAQLVQGHQPQPAVMFRQNEWRAAFRQRVAVTLLDCAAGLLSSDGEVLFFYRQIATGDQSNQVHGIGRRPSFVEIVDSPDEAPFKVAPRAKIFHVQVADSENLWRPGQLRADQRPPLSPAVKGGAKKRKRGLG